MTETVEYEPFATPSNLTLTNVDQIVYASARIRKYCGWHIFPRLTESKTIDAEGGRLLMLPSLKLHAVTITIVETAEVVDSDIYDVSERGMVELRCGWWPRRFASVTVEMDHGYDELPPDLTEVAIAVAKRMPAQQASVSQESAGGVMRSYGGLLSGQASLSAGWTFAEQETLESYRIEVQP